MTSATRTGILVQLVGLLGTAGLSTGEAQGSTSVYRCTSNGVTTFSDRPCDAAAEIHEINTAGMNTFEALPQTAAKSAPPTRKATAARPSDTRLNLSKQKETCARLTQSLKAVRSKTRSGYTAREGERLRAREDRLKTQLRFAKCR